MQIQSMFFKQRASEKLDDALLQQALPTTFGFKAAGWLVSVHTARRELERLKTFAAAQVKDVPAPHGIARTAEEKSEGEHGILPSIARLFNFALLVGAVEVPLVPVRSSNGRLDHLRQAGRVAGADRRSGAAIRLGASRRRPDCQWQTSIGRLVAAPNRLSLLLGQHGLALVAIRNRHLLAIG